MQRRPFYSSALFHPSLLLLSGLLKNCGPTGHLSVYWSTSDETSVMVSRWSPRNLGTQEALLLRKHQTVGSPSAPYKEALWGNLPRVPLNLTPKPEVTEMGAFSWAPALGGRPSSDPLASFSLPVSRSVAPVLFSLFCLPHIPSLHWEAWWVLRKVVVINSKFCFEFFVGEVLFWKVNN